MSLQPVAAHQKKYLSKTEDYQIKKALLFPHSQYQYAKPAAP